MNKAAVKYRRPLNSEQLVVLSLLYRFRFGTSEYIARYLGKTSTKVVQKKLKILEDQEFVAKRYDSSYKLQGKPAEYYLTPKGARQLKARTDDAKLADQVTPQGTKNLYKNPIVSADFMAHCLNILSVAIQIKELYGDKLTVFTRMQLIPYGYFPSWRPDLLLSFKTTAKSTGKQHKKKQYFLDIWDGTRPFFVSVRKARSYLTYAEEGDWPTDQVDFPCILMICENDKSQKKLNRQIRKALDESYEDEVVFGTTAMQQFIESEKITEKLWQKADNPDEQYSLSSFS